MRELQSCVKIYFSEREIGFAEHLLSIDVCHIIVSENVALFNNAVGVVQVALSRKGENEGVAVGIFVDIEPVFAAQKVVYCFKTVTFVPTQVQASRNGEVVVNYTVYMPIGKNLIFVVSAVFQDIF
jgi:hypothetical protein